MHHLQWRILWRPHHRLVQTVWPHSMAEELRTASIKSTKFYKNLYFYSINICSGPVTMLSQPKRTLNLESLCNSPEEPQLNNPWHKHVKSAMEKETQVPELHSQGTPTQSRVRGRNSLDKWPIWRPIFFLKIVVRTINVHSTLLKNFWGYNTVLLTIGMMYPRPLEFIHLA